MLCTLGLLALWSGTARADEDDPEEDSAAPDRPSSALTWAKSTHSPRSAPAGGPLYDACGSRDLGLVKVAAGIVERRLAGLRPPTTQQLETMLRAAGTPQVWPRAWSLKGDHSPAVVAAKLRQWIVKKQGEGHRRCGIAQGVGRNGEPIVAAVVVHALADLQPLPMRTAASRWLKLDARLHVPADDVKVVLLGPLGRPRRVLASLTDGRVRSRFTLDVKGKWLIQVVAKLADGPRPVLEAVAWAGQEPPSRLVDGPDEEAASGTPRPSKLLSLLNRARRKEGLRKLRRDKRLDAVARAHATAMMRSRRAAHDVGDGPPLTRSRRAGLLVHRVGENVASAPTLDRVHRALWDSPSHRENILDASFQSAGVALAIDRSGQIWAVQLFSENP
jgi:Cysteine-rich secretory protein family